MPLIMLKPDALSGVHSEIETTRASAFLCALAGEFSLPRRVLKLERRFQTAADRAHRQVSERRVTEEAFQGIPKDPIHVSKRLLSLSGKLPKRNISTEKVLLAAVLALGFVTISETLHTCTRNDIDHIYGNPPSEEYSKILNTLIEYLAEKNVKCFLLSGYQSSCVLQFWKTYARHLLIERPDDDGTYLVQNLVHVCDSNDRNFSDFFFKETI